ncbi:BMP family lipoprotein [Malacoplasma muris]|uniref:BMP family lipoprotein n=1 Tax=Malacoplasma muris TaxID=2119 RepID=UPI00398F69D9
MKIKKHLWKFGLGAIAVAIPSIALTSCGTTISSKTFAELVVSDDTSTLKDKSFSETTYNGWRNFMIESSVTNQYGIPDHYTKETLDMPDINSNSKDLDLAKGYWRRPGGTRENTFRQIFNGGANLIIAPGFNHKEAVEKVASQMKDKGFILLDSNVDATKGDFTNVASFTFRAEQSGFLAGIATAEFLNTNADVFTTGQGDDGKLKVGGFVGQAFPSTTDFLAGFQHGIISYNLSINKTTSKNSAATTKKEVEWVGLGNIIGNYAVGNFGPGQGVQISQKLINDGKVDAIIPIAGPQTSDAIGVVTSGKRPVIVIGVDSEQEKITELNKPLIGQLGGKALKNFDGKNIDNPQVMQFSAVKKLDEAVYKTLVAIFNEADPNNQNYNNTTNPASNDSTNVETDKAPVQGFGYNNIGTLSNGTVGVSEAGLEWVKSFNSTWFGADGNLNLEELYKDEAYKKLESSGLLYNHNLSNLTDINTLDDSKAVQAPQFIDNTNRVVSALPNNNPPATPNKKEGSTSLNGSIWSLKKGELKQKPESTEPKKYTI